MNKDIWSLHFNFRNSSCTVRMHGKPSPFIMAHANFVFKNLTEEICLKDRFGLLGADFKTNAQVEIMIEQRKGYYCANS